MFCRTRRSEAFDIEVSTIKEFKRGANTKVVIDTCEKILSMLKSVKELFPPQLACVLAGISIPITSPDYETYTFNVKAAEDYSLAASSLHVGAAVKHKLLHDYITRRLSRRGVIHCCNACKIDLPTPIVNAHRAIMKQMTSKK